MYTTISSFIQDYREEAKSTHRLLSLLTEDTMQQEVAPGRRTLGHLAWHLVPYGGLLTPTGLVFTAPADPNEPPKSAAEIAEQYRLTVNSILAAVQEQWTDEKLQQSIPIFGETWTISYTLGMLVKHEIHHRGQLTVLMRQAGLPLVGIYGPTKEEWEQIGMAAPAI
jgi:uncharacterized damage-inducible protein DinB